MAFSDNLSNIAEKIVGKSREEALGVMQAVLNEYMSDANFEYYDDDGKLVLDLKTRNEQIMIWLTNHFPGVTYSREAEDRMRRMQEATFNSIYEGLQITEELFDRVYIDEAGR